MTQKRIRFLLIGTGAIGALVWIAVRVLLLDFDAAVISYGSKTVRTFNTIATAGLIVAALAVAGLIIVVFSQKKEAAPKAGGKPAKKADQHYDGKDIVSKLDKLYETHTVYQKDIVEAKKMIDQIDGCIEDLLELQADNEFEILDKIEYSMRQAKMQILQNTKSIVNRITIEGDPQEITKRLNTNSEILKQVRGLLHETVNYLDSKSPSTRGDLDSMTKALQSLNNTIE
ncbi:hypothetical protein ACYSNR_07880 [Enterococcus sp. LJL128]